MGDSKLATRRTRAVGTRDRVLSHLAQAGEIRDESGMASAVLARQIGYPGSSIAFAQLLSGMDRAGLICREVRGKRTYRIRLVVGPLPGSGEPPAMVSQAAGPAATGPAATGMAATGPAATGMAATGMAATGMAATGPAVPNATGSGPGVSTARSAKPDSPGDETGAARPGPGAFDYDELARRLLVQFVRHLAAAPGRAGTPDAALVAENARLKEQLREARRRLALAQERRVRPAITEQLDGHEISLLERLLAGGAAES